MTAPRRPTRRPSSLGTTSGDRRPAGRYGVLALTAAVVVGLLLGYAASAC